MSNLTNQTIPPTVYVENLDLPRPTSPRRIKQTEEIDNDNLDQRIETETSSGG